MGAWGPFRGPHVHRNAGITSCVRSLRLRVSSSSGRSPPEFGSATIPSMPSSSRSAFRRSITPALSVLGEKSLQIGNLVRSEANKDGQAHLADDRKRLLGVGRHPDRRMGILIRAGRDGRVLEAIELAVVTERLALPRLPDDV